MPKKKAEKSPLQELADKADEALNLCWERLGARDVDDEMIRTMIKAWRTKHAAYNEAEEQRQLKREERDNETD